MQSLLVNEHERAQFRTIDHEITVFGALDGALDNVLQVYAQSYY